MLTRDLKRQTSSAVLLAFTAFTSLAGCGRNVPESNAGDAGTPTLTASTLGVQTVLTAAEYRALPEFRNANAEHGERLSMQCRACHTFEQDGPHVLGPNLFEFFGRPAGSTPGFPYSSALAESNFVWTPRSLDAWLAAPREFLPGNMMAYQGLPNSSDRAALISSLLVQTEAFAE